jgi:hypothetical protein
MPADPSAAELFDFLAADLGPVRVNLSFRDWLRERLWETLASCLARHPSRH